MIGAVFLQIYRFGIKNDTANQHGWGNILFGLAFILHGSFWDFLGNFPSFVEIMTLNNFNLLFVIENFLGYVLGIALIAVGLKQWLPNVKLIYDENSKFQSSQKALESENSRLSHKISSQVTELGKIRASKLEAEGILSNFIQHSPSEIGVKDTDGRYRLVNQIIEENYGMPASEVIGRRPRDIFPGPIAEQLEAHDHAVLKLGQPIIKEVSAVLKGQERFYKATKFPIRNDQNEITGIGAIATDITDQKIAEFALRDSEYRYRLLFEQSPVPFMEEDWSETLRIIQELEIGSPGDLGLAVGSDKKLLAKLYDSTETVTISDSMTELYRAKSKQEFMESLVAERADPSEVYGFGRAVSALFDGADYYQYQAQETTCDGSEIHTRITFSVPREFRNSWSRVLVSVEDITDQAFIEANLRRSQKLESLGQLTGGVAHDFNNLLAVVQGNAELLAETMPHENELVTEIINAAGRGAELTRRLLVYARKQPLTPKAFDINALVSEIKNVISRSIGEKIELCFDPAPTPIVTLADPNQLQDAILNLAINARDAMMDGGRLRISCSQIDFTESQTQNGLELSPGLYTKLTVADEGDGMDETTLSKALDPFFTTKDVDAGSGLGLSMVYGFVKQSGGGMELESRLGVGTTITLFIPAGGRQTSHIEPDILRSALGSGEKILVIEDDAAVRNTLCMMLSELGYDVVSADRAVTARRLVLDNNTFDAVVSDLVLPGGISGLDFANELKELGVNWPFLFISGYSLEIQHIQNSTEYGKSVLRKPFRKAELANCLASCIHTGQPGDQFAEV